MIPLRKYASRPPLLSLGSKVLYDFYPDIEFTREEIFFSLFCTHHFESWSFGGFINYCFVVYCILWGIWNKIWGKQSNKRIWYIKGKERAGKEETDRNYKQFEMNSLTRSQVYALCNLIPPYICQLKYIVILGSAQLNHWENQDLRNNSNYSLCPLMKLLWNTCFSKMLNSEDLPVCQF